jgi:hypothetical protein
MSDRDKKPLEPEHRKNVFSAEPASGAQAQETIAHAPHGHGGAHPPAEEDRIHSKTIVFVGVAALVVFFVASLVAIAAMKKQQRDLLPDGPAPLPAELGQSKIGVLEQRLFEYSNQAAVLREVQRRKLESAGWVDRAQGVARLPIGRAMELVVQGERPAPTAPPARGTASGGGTERGMGDSPTQGTGGAR